MFSEKWINFLENQINNIISILFYKCKDFQEKKAWNYCQRYIVRNNSSIIGRYFAMRYGKRKWHNKIIGR
jgi:hypothetical protein